MDRPPLVAPMFWNHPEISAALARRHMGQLIAAYRRHPDHPRPLRQADVAGWAQLSQVQLSRIENGPPIQQLDRLIGWARLLGVPADLLWFRLPQQPHRDPPPGAGPCAALPGRGAFRLVRVGDAAPLDAAHAFRAADSTVGGGHLYAEVVAYLHHTLAPRLFDTDADTAVYASAAGLTEMAAWMAHDAGDDGQAGRHFHAALKLSRLGEDRQLRAHILASLAHLALHRGHPDEALRHLYDGEAELSRGPRHPELSARLYALAARAAALQQRPRDTRLLLDRAAAALGVDAGAAPPLSAWVSRYDQASLASEAARCLRHLGDRVGAAQQAERIIALRPPERARARAFGQLALAEVVLDQRDLEQACALTETVVAATGDLRSYLVLRRLETLRRRLEAFRAVPVVGTTYGMLESVLVTREREWISPSPYTRQ